MTAALDAEVRSRAHNCCEYCLVPQAAFRRPFHIEHIIARQHGGRTELDNLALSCWDCNFKKGPNLSGIDPETSSITPLFNPRIDRWSDHFRSVTTAPNENVPLGIAIVGRTPAGRATVVVLDMNQPFRCQLRQALAAEGMYV